VMATHFQGDELNSPNDVVVASDDSIIFTDPDWGRTSPLVGLQRDVQLDFRGVLRVRAEGGDTELLVGDFEQPNGLCLSPDESRLYVNDTPRAHIRVFEVGPDFRLSNARVFAENIGDGDVTVGVVDGMKVDELGNVYVTGPEGICVFSPAGVRIGVIEIPEVTGNLNWGDADWRALYVAASSSIYRVRMSVAGNRLPYMR
jgi:gluconolactonase